MELTAPIVKYGNSHYFRIRSEFIKSGMLKEGRNYDLKVETEMEELERTNKLLAEKLALANSLLKQKGFDEINADEDTEKSIEQMKEVLNKSNNVPIGQEDESETQMLPRNSEERI